MYQRVKADKKMMMGMSLAYSLFNPVGVNKALQDATNFDVQEPTPDPTTLLHQENQQEKQASDATAQNLLPLDTARQPYA